MIKLMNSRVNFIFHIISENWENGRGWFFPCETLSWNYKWYWKTANCTGANTSDFKLGVVKIILRKFYWYCQSLMSILSRSGNIKNFRCGTLPYSADEKLNKQETNFMSRSSKSIVPEEKLWIKIAVLNLP